LRSSVDNRLGLRLPNPFKAKFKHSSKVRVDYLSDNGKLGSRTLRSEERRHLYRRSSV